MVSDDDTTVTMQHTKEHSKFECARRNQGRLGLGTEGALTLESCGVVWGGVVSAH